MDGRRCNTYLLRPFAPKFAYGAFELLILQWCSLYSDLLQPTPPCENVDVYLDETREDMHMIHKHPLGTSRECAS